VVSATAGKAEENAVPSRTLERAGRSAEATNAGRTGEAVQPEAVPNGRTVEKDAVPSPAPEQMCRKAGNWRMGARDALPNGNGRHRAPDSG
jgi:hypothetical protein